jgi:hypothetical protein
VIRADSAGIGTLARDLVRVVADVPKTFAQAASSVARASGTEAKREITAIYNIKQGRVGEDVKSIAKGYEVITTGKSKGITLQSFGGRQAAKGYMAAVRKGRRKLIKGGFTPSKFGGVPFRREGHERMPIKVLYGPSVASMLRNREVHDRFVLRQSIRARDELTRRIFRELSKR